MPGSPDMEKVMIVSIDLMRVEKDDSFPAAYAFYVDLDKEPSMAWASAFMGAYDSALHTMKRPVRLEGKKIRVVTGDTDNIQKHVDFVKKLVEWANADVTRRRAKMAEACRLQEACSRGQQDAVAHIREALSKVEL